MLLTLHPAAQEEFLTAFEWYENQQKGLGIDFMNCVEKRLNQIIENPTFYSKKQHTKFREVRIERFPFIIVYDYKVRKAEIFILAIYHAKRNPLKKYRRSR